MTQEFDTLYAGLNEAQRQAVEAIDGPVMVIAGPGTGKTQILAARILNILRKTDASPEEILCLTYTEAGTAAMRQRLSRFMGADAYRVNIHTFHGLCNRIIQEYPEKFAQRELRVMDDLEKMELMDGLIQNIPAGSPIKNYQEDPKDLRKQLDKLFNLMQEEDLSADFFTHWVNEISPEPVFTEIYPEMVYKRNGKFGAAGTVNQKKYQEQLLFWEKLKAASSLFQDYQKKKKELGIYEFRDMIHWVLDALKSDEDLLRNYQEKFQYVLVDEYQDTSGVQNEIVYALISYWDDNPNCFVVGDDDQSIYAFQGARVDNMKDFIQRYKSRLTKIVLTDNYRSTQKILDSAALLIAHNQDRLVNEKEYNLNKDLVAHSHYATHQPLQFLRFRNRFHEANGIADLIKAQHAAGCPWAEMAVIYARHSAAEELAGILRQEHIPFVLARSVDILTQPLIKQLVHWLQYLALELDMPHSGEYLLYELLHYDLYAIEPYQVASIASEIYAANKKDGLKWRDYLAQMSDQPADPKREALVQLWKNVEYWLKQAASLNVPQLVEQVISNAGFLSAALKSEEREWNLEILHTFINYSSVANQRRPFLTLGQFMEDLTKMQANGISIPIEKRIGSTDGVTLTTAHSSKGLEFQHVWIIGAEQEFWEKDRTNALPFRLSKLFEGIKQKGNPTPPAGEKEEEDAQERRRLFYVALTRAKESLTVSWASHKMDAKSTDLHPSRFVVEIQGGGEIPEATVSAQVLVQSEARLLSLVQAPVLPLSHSDWLRQQLQGFKFSPSTLYDILECGLRFYFSRIVHVPSAPSAPMGYGNAVHNTLARLVDSGVNKQLWPDQETFLSWFEYEMFKLRSSFSRISYQTRSEQGKDQLPLYYAARMPEFQQYREVKTETWLETSIDGIIIGGKSDKLIFNGNDVTIVDYKTGKARNAEKKFVKPGEKAIADGKLPPKYWFQLGLYHIIVNNQHGKDWKAVLSVIDAVEPDENGAFHQFKQTYSAEDLEILTTYLIEGNRRLQTLEFLTGCGHKDCEWCNFAKETGQSVLIPEMEIN
ncbi:MAG: ATP-dependent helicase [Bacteroidetes bacterium]|nr:ATP-dependent helicase [Bacteroidota bacterium]